MAKKEVVATRTIRFQGLITLEHVATGEALANIITNEIISNLESVWTEALVTVHSCTSIPSANGLPTPSSGPSDRG